MILRGKTKPQYKTIECSRSWNQWYLESIHIVLSIPSVLESEFKGRQWALEVEGGVLDPLYITFHFRTPHTHFRTLFKISLVS